MPLRLAFRPMLIVGVLLVSACSRGASVTSAPTAARDVVRVYDTRAGSFTSFESMAATARRADLVFFAEQHDDPVTHAMELAVLAALADGGRRPVLSLEMFERDVQDTVNAYAQGRIPETDFLKHSRPWERYATDYRGMVELARARGWPVVASNVPRRIANLVSRAGLGALDTLAASDKAWIAAQHSCALEGEYFSRFAEQMKGHGNGGPASAPDTVAMRRMTARFYEAQCVKDEAMGEAVAAAWTRHGGPVLHVNGAFHSDYGLGTAERARRRVPAARSVLISAIPVTHMDSLPVAEYRGRGDYLLFTRRHPAPK